MPINNNILSGKGGLQGIPEGPVDIGGLTQIGRLGFNTFKGDVPGILTGVGGVLGNLAVPGIGAVVGSFLGGLTGKLFGGGGKRGVPVQAIDISKGPTASIVSRLGLTKKPRDFRRFRNVYGPLSSDRRAIQNAGKETIKKLNLFGFTGLADEVKTAINRSNRVASSPQGFARQIDDLLEFVNGAELVLQGTVEGFKESPKLAELFRRKSGLDFNRNFLPEYLRRENAFVAGTQLPGAERALRNRIKSITTKKLPRNAVDDVPLRSAVDNYVNSRPDISGFKLEFTPWPEKIIGYIKRFGDGRSRRPRGPERISVGEYNRRVARARDEFMTNQTGGIKNDIANLKKLISSPMISDINNLANVFGKVFGQKPINSRRRFKIKIPRPELKQDFLPAGSDLTSNSLEKEQDLIIPSGFISKRETTASRAIDPGILDNII